MCIHLLSTAVCTFAEVYTAVVRVHYSEYDNRVQNLTYIARETRKL
jgi:hypothetical protein